LFVASCIIRERFLCVGAREGLASGAQLNLYRAFAKMGSSLTWDAVETIETQALVRGGMGETMARATVVKAINALKVARIQPTRIPWGGSNA
jgi:hypothetical protein